MSRCAEKKHPQAAVLKALLSSDTMARLDKGKLVKSQEIRDVAQFAVEHALIHGDRTYLQQILGLFQRSACYRAVLMWLSDACALKYGVKDGKIVFRSRRKATPTELGSIENYLRQYSGTRKKVMCDAPKKHKPKKAPEYIDMLDSRARLSGCYGAGKRR